MYGALIKSYYAKKNNIDPSKIFVVAVMPCTAKKFECERPELNATGYPDVDAVITTVELAKMIKSSAVSHPISHISDGKSCFNSLKSNTFILTSK